MMSRFKLIVAVLGLMVATGATGEASARVIDRTIVKKTVITRSVVTPHFHRVVVVPRPVFHRFVAYRAPVVVRTRILAPRIVRAPVVVDRRVALRRTFIHKTIIR